MISSSHQLPSLGFENLSLRGLEAQQRDAARSLKENGAFRGGRSSDELTADQQRQVDELKSADRRVRAHEQAHMAAGGELVRGSSYSFETGPDNKRYAVAGEVSIDTSKGATPDETIPKAIRIRDAALAPADPSSQDRRVAAEAAQMEYAARQEAVQLAADERRRAESERSSQAIGAYQLAGGLQLTAGFSAVA